MAKKQTFFFLAMLLLIVVDPGNCGNISANSSYGFFSDGVMEEVQFLDHFLVFKYCASSDSYNEKHGVMPFTVTVLRDILIILVYVSLMLFAAKLLYDGSEILVEVLSPGIHGGVFLALLTTTLLDAIIILASRLCGNTETARSQVSTGIGVLTGSTAMLLTLLGGCLVIVGRPALENSRKQESEEDTKGFSLTGSAISTDIRASYSARIMVISVMPFIVVQLSQVLHATSQIRLPLLISLIISVSLSLAYCFYQVFHPAVLKRKLAYAKHKHMISAIDQHLKCCSPGELFTANVEPDKDVIRKLYEMIGENSDQLLSASGDSKINMDEFIKGISKWLNEAEHSAVSSSDSDNTPTTEMHELLGFQNSEVVKIKNPRWSTFRAILMLLLGSLIAATFADLLANAVGNFSSATDIPSFFVSFVVLPFAISSEAVSALIFASKKKLRIALTFSETMRMNNLLCLSAFLALLYYRLLTWNFTSEVLIILIIWSFLPKEH